MKNKSVQIIVLNWNQKQLSLDCIESLKKTYYKKKQIIFVDNASSDGSVGYIGKKHPDIEIIQAPKNLGYAGGNNFGFRSIKNKLTIPFLLIMIHMLIQILLSLL